MEKSNAVKILQSRTLLTETGVEYAVKVTNVTPFQREDGSLVNILNFNAMTPYHATQAKKLLADGQFQEATNQNISSSARIGIDFTPAKGQNVYITLAEAKSKTEVDANGNPVTILVVQSVRALDKAKGMAISFEDDEVEGAEVVEGAEAALEVA